MDTGYRLRKGLFKGFSSFFEALVVFFTSFLLTFIQEAWRATGRTFSSFVAVVLGFLNKPAFERWVNEHRARIVQAGTPLVSSKASQADAPAKKSSIILSESKKSKKTAAEVRMDPKYVENLEIPKPEVKLKALKRRKVAEEGGYETEKEKDKGKSKKREKKKDRKTREQASAGSDKDGSDLEAIGLGIPNEFKKPKEVKTFATPPSSDSESGKEKAARKKKKVKGKEGKGSDNESSKEERARKSAADQSKKASKLSRKDSSGDLLDRKPPKQSLRTKSSEAITEEPEDAQHSPPQSPSVTPPRSPSEQKRAPRTPTRRSIDSVSNPLEQTYDTETDQDLEYAVDDFPRDKLFTHEKIHTGFFEDIRISILVTIMSVRAWLTEHSNAFFEAVSEYRFRNLLRSMISFDFWLSPVWWLLSLVYILARVVLSLVTTPAIVPKSIGQVTSSFIERRFTNVDKSDRKAMLESKGYPFEQHQVVTDDGYILTLERLPRPNSTKVCATFLSSFSKLKLAFSNLWAHKALGLYLQHGVFDSAYAWFAETHHVGMNIAFRAYDLGYDVFAGTLRGCAPAKEHIDPNISGRDFWNFTVNEHAFNDIPAFVAKIRELKNAELGRGKDAPALATSRTASDSSSSSPSLPFTISVVSHSMGAMATLMYIVKSRVDGNPHHIDSAVLLSPAGVHKTAPMICKVTGPFISGFLWAFPWATYSFRFPSELVRTFAAKMVEDVRENYSSRQLLSFMAYKMLGGEKTDHTYIRAHNITYNVFSGTSAGIFKHFWQVWKRQKFEGFDYGPVKNLAYYGQTEPVNILANYKAVDIPLHFVMGLRDTLIEPVSVMTHYDTLQEVHPELAHLKAFPKMGHIDFTVGENSEVSNFIFDALSQVAEAHRLN